MRVGPLRLADLPPPPSGQTGWPWTVETPPLPPAQADGSPWPRISIVTPSFNQGPYIEKTLRSVLLQGYPNLEYIVVDGGSTDQALRIIALYGDYLNAWSSEPDRGQCHAINKGLAQCTGDYFNWLNSDDVLQPGALARIARVARERRLQIVVGRCRIVDENDQLLYHWPVYPHRSIVEVALYRPPITQPSCFVSMQTARAAGPLREDVHYALDWEWYFRIARRLGHDLKIAYLDDDLSTALLHADAKTARGTAPFLQEQLALVREVAGDLWWWDRVRIARGLKLRQRQSEIAVALRQPLSKFSLGMLHLLMRDPLLVLFRPYLGALKARVSEAVMKSTKGGRQI